MTILSNTRKDPFTGAVSYRPMDPEIKIISEFANLPGRYGFQAQDKPSPGMSTIIHTVGGIPFDQVTVSPLEGQVRIDNDTGFLFFNVADDGVSATINYQGGGSNNSIENVQSISSPISFEVNDNGFILNTSLTDVLLTGMSITPGAGNYLVWFSTSVTNNTNNASVSFSIFQNGILLPNSTRLFQRGLQAISTPFATTGKVNGLLDGQSIEIYWRVSAGQGVAQLRSLSLLKVQ